MAPMRAQIRGVLVRASTCCVANPRLDSFASVGTLVFKRICAPLGRETVGYRAEHGEAYRDHLPELGRYVPVGCHWTDIGANHDPDGTAADIAGQVLKAMSRIQAANPSIDGLFALAWGPFPMRSVLHHPYARLMGVLEQLHLGADIDAFHAFVPHITLSVLRFYGWRPSTSTMMMAGWLS